ncbi:unnamed protein product [Pneumocystis jirovecii]|uniref:DNA replication factor Cdt1 C-terminal domain-containing protein n=2 Tax=Pneumocystis jirovecii TaxID=42068 RepID=L0PD67_PNEJI|nr:uncharacterized protein T551_02600 [Pneumocystis jirovecii RU7]KTW28750.1 hypothetical protein T551_02600 [Pneumocystis jirovecii RU7]CCJ29575.1 unnamed protein product [Pneumocystis jirovecii]
MSKPIYTFLPPGKPTSIKRKKPLGPELPNKRINVEENYRNQVSKEKENPNTHQLNTSIVSIFSALDNALVYYRAINNGEGSASFHHLQQSVEMQAKKSFTLESLETIINIWPDSFKISPVIILFNGTRIGSLSIDFPSKKFNLTTRLKQFRSYLESPPFNNINLKELIPKNPSKDNIYFSEKKKQAIQGLQKKTISTISSSPIDHKGLKYRQASLLERIRFKHTQNMQISSNFTHLAALQKLSNIIDCLFILLATYPSKSAFSISEVVTALTSSLKQPLSNSEIQHSLTVLANTFPEFCQIIKISNTLSAIKFHRNYKFAELKKNLELKQTEFQT